VLKTAFAPFFVLRFALVIITFVGVGTTLQTLLPIELGFFAMVFLFIVLFSLLDRYVARERQIYVLVPFTLVSLVLAAQNPGQLALIIGTTVLLFLITMFFVARLGDFVFVREVAIADLTTGCVPANIIVRDDNGDYRAEDVALTSLIAMASRPRHGELVVDITPEGLSESKIAELQELAEDGKLAGFGNVLKIQESVPFAPIIFTGVVLTILSGGLFIYPIVELIGRSNGG
jgi:prepilin signal peptidase PulO-like enzyme (type II secretory pathway)